MRHTQEYKIKIDQIIDRLPAAKVEELLDYATYLNDKCARQNLSQINEASLLIQQESLKKIWDNPEEDIYEL